MPEGATVVFSAHGIAPAVRREAEELRLTTIDATCPLVTKVHAQARRYAEAGYAIVLIGHAGHEEVEGTLGEAPDAIVLVQSRGRCRARLAPGRPAARIHHPDDALGRRDRTRSSRCCAAASPRSRGRRREDICYATSNRQWAVKELLREVDLLLVIGSPNSSNSQRLVDVARAEGTSAHLVDDVSGIDERWLEDCETVGLTSGASAPERLVAEVCAWFTARGAEVCEQAPVHEDVSFKLPGRAPPRRAHRGLALLERSARPRSDVVGKNLALDPARRDARQFSLRLGNREHDPVGQLEALLLAREFTRWMSS